MNKIIEELENNGMLFDKRCDKVSASNYLNYNVTWPSLRNSLKQFSNTIEYNIDHAPKMYQDIYFYDLIQAGLLDYYYNETIKTLLNEFEQLFKNYFLNVFESLSNEEQNNVITFLNNTHDKERFVNDSIRINDIYGLFSFVTLVELIDIFNNLLFKHQTLVPYVIPQEFALFFKEAIYNKGLSLYSDDEDNLMFKDIEINFGFFDSEQVSYLENNPYHNSCYLAVQLIKLTYILQSRHDNLLVRREYTKNSLVTTLDKCKTSLSKSHLFDTWVHSHFAIIDTTLKNTYLI